MLSLFTEFITEFESTWAITVYLNNYLSKVKGRSINNNHFTFGKYFLIFIHYYVILPNAKYTFVIHTVEQGRNRERSDVCGPIFQF